VTASKGVLPYHYEYVIYNLNSDTSADRFTVAFGHGATISAVGFRDLPHHSGEPYDTSDWTIDVDAANGSVTWTAVDMGADTNALRWGFAFNFWFDADAGPQPSVHELGTFQDDGSLPVAFEGSAFFRDGFESGDTSGWD
jgi:hypothetical protein